MSVLERVHCIPILSLQETEYLSTVKIQMRQLGKSKEEGLDLSLLSQYRFLRVQAVTSRFIPSLILNQITMQVCQLVDHHHECPFMCNTYMYCTYRKSSIKPPEAYLILGLKKGGVLERGAYFKS